MLWLLSTNAGFKRRGNERGQLTTNAKGMWVCSPCRMERTMKVCKTCGVEKPLDEFYRESKLRWKPDCKPCYDTKRKQWKVFGGPRDRSGVGQQTSERYAENPGKHRRQNSSYKARNPDKIRAAGLSRDTQTSDELRTLRSGMQARRASHRLHEAPVRGLVVQIVSSRCRH
jgi:hypothetical protein